MTNHNTWNLILHKPNELLSEVHKMIFINNETAFRSPQEKVVFQMEKNNKRHLKI